jgi:DNA-binding transcriptional LysR family regulator
MYRLFVAHKCTTIPQAAEKLGVKAGYLYKLVRAFGHQSGQALFAMGLGRRETKPILGVRSDAVLETIGRILDLAKPLLEPDEFCIRIAAGVTAASCLLPPVIREFFREVNSAQISFDLSYGQPDVLVERADEFDIVLAETVRPLDMPDDTPGPFEPKINSPSRRIIYPLPLRLVVPRTHPLARSTDELTWHDVTTHLANERLAILDEARPFLPTYPTQLTSDDQIRIERLKSHLLIHALALTGTAAALTTPALLSDEQRRELRVLRLPPDAGHIYLNLESPSASRYRSDSQKLLIGKLFDQIGGRLETFVWECPQETDCREEWHVSYRDGEARWAKASIGWYQPEPLVYSGWYDFGSVKYRLDGNAAKSSDGRVHLVFKALRDRDRLEEFVASYISTPEQLAGQEAMVGVWLGRRTPRVDDEPFRPSMGYSVLLAHNDVANITANRLNGLVKSVRAGDLAGDLRFLQLAHTIATR